MSEPIRVMLVDDHPIVRSGLTVMIDDEDDLRVVGEAGDARAAVHGVLELQPDVVVLDLSLGGESGLTVLKRLRESDFKGGVLVMSMHEEGLYAERAVRLGANGYIMKQEASEKVLLAIRQVHAGNVYLSPAMSMRLLNAVVRGHGDGQPVERLTDRELEVFQLMGEGNSTREIAASLSVSVKTVETHRANIKTKIGARNSTELIHRAVHFTLKGA